MSGFLGRLLGMLRGALGNRGTERQRSVLLWLKGRYHIFRILLAGNERTLELLAEVDRLAREDDAEGLAEVARELLERLQDLVDGLNRLSDSAYLGLYGRFARLHEQVEAALGSSAPQGAGGCLALDQLAPGLGHLTGGKAQRLGELRRAGLPVPDGFVVGVGLCRQFLRDARLDERIRGLLHASAADGQPDGLADEARLTAVAGQIQRMILAAELPEELRAALHAAWQRLEASAGVGLAISVRSSAVSEDSAAHSFAGQYRTVLNVTGVAALEQAFREVVASAFGARVIAYRRHAGLPQDVLDMAVLCQRLVAARASGVLYTADPTSPATDGRMLLTAVAGMGTVAVSGESPADIYRPSRSAQGDVLAEIAVKTVRDVPQQGGGLRRESLAQEAGGTALLSEAQVRELAMLGRRIELLQDGPQDIEWALDAADRLWILQARPAQLAEGSGADAQPWQGRVLLQGGVPASPGRAVGRAVLAQTREDLAALDATGTEPLVLVLHQSLVDAAMVVPRVAAVVVDMGNPLDHLACLAREWGRPMVTGLGTATRTLPPGQWLLVDGQRGVVLEADAALWQGLPPEASVRPGPGQDERHQALRELLLPLNLTDAYGPTFAVSECRTAHDLLRFVHEKAVLAMFHAGDAITEEAGGLVRRLEDDVPLHFLVIDLGGGLAPGGRVVRLAEVLSAPLLALCDGMATPGLRWSTPPPIPGLSGLMSSAMLDKRGERPVGELNYALVSRDYLNLNARVDFHFAMVDAVCGQNPRENSVRFRFKGGGTSRVQRERRARFVEQVLLAEEFYTSRQGDLVTAAFTEGPSEVVREKLVMLGRFLGFSRLLDAAMVNDDMPGLMAQAFREGDYGLTELARRLAEQAA